MKHKMILLWLLLSNLVSAINAQDTIVKKNGDEVQAKVTEINETEVKYKNFSNPDGPAYTMLVSDIFMIKYENGEKDLFEKKTKNEKKTVSAKSEITTVEELTAIGNDANSLIGRYTLMNDLTLENWTPIGDEKSDFSGVFDGNGHTITILNFKVDTLLIKENVVNIGLFRTIGNKGIIKNLRVAGEINCSSGTTTMHIGGIAGRNEGSISACISTINIIADGGKYTTGKGIITGLTPAMLGQSNAILLYQNGVYGGSIAGVNKGVVKNCYSTGFVSLSGAGFKCAGGIVGGNGFNSGSTEHCYATGSISAKTDGATRYVGGVVGMNVVSMQSCVALNDKIEAEGKNNGITLGVGLGEAANYALGVVGLNFKNGASYQSKYTYSRADMMMYVGKEKVISGERLDMRKGVKKESIVEYSTTQKQDWWVGIPKKFGFTFGTDDNAPWVWNDELKRPVLYWENPD